MELAIKLSDVAFRWHRDTPNVLNIADWQVEAGRKVFVYGPSGSGKSTLLNVLSGVLRANQGEVSVLGQNLQQLSGSRRDQFRANHMGMIFQQFNLLPYLSGRDNIKLAGYFSQARAAQPEQHFAQICAQLQLSESLLAQSAGHMSVGQQQRIAVARALINQPQLIIADEPTSALDSELRDQFINLLLNCAADSTVIFVSHDRSLLGHFEQHVELSQLNQQVA